MRAVQTLWTGNKNLLKDSFGWIHPQYNLMSWALSCLSLKEHYEDVVLYTDFDGYTMFHDYLKLPYKDIIVQYEGLNCHQELWAYSKLFTYSLQEKPFIHVDGDVYLPHRLPKDIETGGLIAQNAEIGTSYYKHMVNEIMIRPIAIPDLLLEEMKKDSVSSYNAGVLGGNDLDFIREYCQTAFEFIENNQLRNVDGKAANVNCNILFEQILFHCLVEAKNKKVSTVIDHSINDNGYSYNEFCDFYSFDTNKLMHIIGGHKRNERICELLSRTLLDKYPEYYERIIKLFPSEHKRLDKNITIQNPLFEIQNNIRQYEDFLNKEFQRWNKKTYKTLFEQEQKVSNYFQFLKDPVEKQEIRTINRNPYLFIYETKGWDIETRSLMKNRLSGQHKSGHFDIACIPSLLHNGCKEVIINDLCYNILELLQKPQNLYSLSKELKPYLPVDIRENKEFTQNLILQTLEYLFYNKLIYIE